MINKVTDDIYRRLKADGFLRYQDLEDVRQSVNLVYLELTERKGGEPVPGYLYRTAFYRIRDTLTSTTCDSNLTRVDYIDFAELESLDVLSDPSERYLDKEATRNSDAILAHLDHMYHLGIDISDQLGLIFALWWIGMEYDMIGLTLAAAGLKPTSKSQVYRNMKKVFSEIFHKTGLYPSQVQQARLRHDLAMYGV